MFTGFDISLLIPGMPPAEAPTESTGLAEADRTALQMARALVREGARVTVFCATTRLSSDADRVQYLPEQLWRDYVRGTPHDICIVQHSSEPFAVCTSTRLNLVWRHDAARGRDLEAFQKPLWNVDKVIVNSPAMHEQHQQAYELDEEAFLVSSGGSDWPTLAREWLAAFERLIRQRTDSPDRMMRHFCRSADFVAARHLLRSPSADARLSSILAETLSETVDLPPASESARAARQCSDVLVEWLEQSGAALGSILVCGGDHDTFTAELMEALPSPDVQGVALGAAPTDAAFDCALLQGGLESAPEPWRTLEDVERSVRSGGKVLLCVPFGPWAAGKHQGEFRRAIWQFDGHDLRDMLGSKAELTIEAVHHGDSAKSGEPLGSWLVSYSADHRPVQPVDLDRHVWLQRPRQTVSAALIAGPGSEETLHWAMRSIAGVSDEIIIADCGMNDEARRVAALYGVRLVTGVDPKVEGFERARNIALDACRFDWCLWIDTDEKLVGTENLPKYLRENLYQTYCIKQHQFECDRSMGPAIAPRLFRRRPYREKSLRFVGAIHEYPELAVNQGPGPAIFLSDVDIAHLGYMDGSARQARFHRNLPLLDLDEQRYPERLVQKGYRMRENMHLVRHALRQKQGEVDVEIAARCRETIEIYRKYFLDAEGDPGLNPLEHYSEALEILHEGFEAAIQLEVEREGARSGAPMKYRFASNADLQKLLKRELERKTSRMQSPWW